MIITWWLLFSFGKKRQNWLPTARPGNSPPDHPGALRVADLGLDSSLDIALSEVCQSTAACTGYYNHSRVSFVDSSTENCFPDGC